MQRRLSRLFAEREVKKRYVALVAGLVAGERGSIDAPLAADWPNRPRQQVDHAGGKPALTHWTVLERDPARGITRLELEPVSGRSHQLRVHLLSIGHPILGDVLYAPGHAASRLMLHAAELAFQHPVLGRPSRLRSAVPF
jgi:tRNA pseudouridine32 synthase/23S rRNA pseudouridine746 synthase